MIILTAEARCISFFRLNYQYAISNMKNFRFSTTISVAAAFLRLLHRFGICLRSRGAAVFCRIWRHMADFHSSHRIRLLMVLLVQNRI